MRAIKQMRSIKGLGLLWAFCLVCVVCSCSGGGDDPSDGSSSESGQVIFTLRLAEEYTGVARFQEASAQLDCMGNHIDTITAEILNAAGDVIAAGGPFDCMDGHGTISGRPPWPGLRGAGRGPRS